MSGNRLTPRAFFAREIQCAREAKGMSPDALAKVLFVSESLVRAWEKGRRLPKPDVMTRLEEVLGTGGILARILGDLVDAAVPIEWFGRWVEIERQASAFWSFEPLLIPGLLQNEDYARTVLHAANHNVDLTEMLAARMERRGILTREDPPMYVALIAEGALRHNVGGPEVMHEQCSHLLEMTHHDNVILHVVPEDSKACAGFLSGFVIASFDGGDLAYVDNQLSGDVIDGPEDVARLRRWFDVFRADALSRDESSALIARTVDKWKS